MPSTASAADIARPVITLTTDFGLDDWYVAILKAVLLRHCQDARLVDVTHRLPPGDILRGSICLERAVDAFPPGTVHLAVVDPGVGSDRRLLIARIRDQWVVCPDNGLITWCWHRHVGGRSWELTWRPAVCSHTFHGRDIMAPVAGMLAGGVAVETLGRSVAQPVLLDVAPAAADATVGRIIHIDRFGNAMTNLPEQAVRTMPGVEVWVEHRRIGTIRQTYADVPSGQPLALIGSSGMLEIAVRDGSAFQRLGLSIGQQVRLQSPGQRNAELQRLDKQHIWHPFTPMSIWLDSDPLIIVAADGMNLIDAEGNRYLDGVSSLWCNVHGHRVPEIDQAIRFQLDRVAHSTMLGLSNEPAILLADRLMKLVPPNLTKVFYSDSGATATEIAFKLAVQYWYNLGKPGKTEFIGLAEAYHGDTVGAMSVGRTAAFHKPYFPLLFKVHYAPTPHRAMGPVQDAKAWALAEMERLLAEHHDRIAAIALEPVVQGAAGMLIQPPGYLAQVRMLADKYGVLLICDEVATGFGRTGRMFAVEHEGVQPDLMCIAKGISGGYLPLAATLATQQIFDAFLGQPWEGRTFFHGHTYTGNPLACAAAIASLELFEKNDLLRRVRDKSTELSRMLDGLRDLPHVGSIRQKGFMVGIELVEDKSSGRPFDPRRRIGHAVCAAVRKHGVILRPLGDVMVMMPPLAMEVGDLRRIVDAVGTEVASLR